MFLALKTRIIRGFPKIRGTFLGVPMARIFLGGLRSVVIRMALQRFLGRISKTSMKWKLVLFRGL